jgi:hypothetical protein
MKKKANGCSEPTSRTMKGVDVGDEYRRANKQAKQDEMNGCSFNEPYQRLPSFQPPPKDPAIPYQFDHVFRVSRTRTLSSLSSIFSPETPSPPPKNPDSYSVPAS